MLFSLTACSSMDRFVCYGTGTCDRDPRYANVAAGKYISPLPQTVYTTGGTYIITTDQSTGAIFSINSVSRGK